MKVKFWGAMQPLLFLFPIAALAADVATLAAPVVQSPAWTFVDGVLSVCRQFMH